MQMALMTYGWPQEKATPAKSNYSVLKRHKSLIYFACIFFALVWSITEFILSPQKLQSWTKKNILVHKEKSVWIMNKKKNCMKNTSYLLLYCCDMTGETCFIFFFKNKMTQVNQLKKKLVPARKIVSSLCALIYGFVHPVNDEWEHNKFFVCV